jgi:hypothetical protein
MLRVLMVLEDYGELMFLQTVLKKIGFDVDAIQNPRGFQSSLLRMNPDVLVMTAFGKRIHGLELNKGVRRHGGVPRTILLRSPGVVHIDETVAAWVDTPVAALELLNTIADVCNLNKQLYQDKFQKLQLREIEQATRQLHPLADGSDETFRERSNEEEGPLVPSDLRTSTMPLQERRERYQKFLNAQRPEQAGFSVKDVQDKVRELRKSEDPADREELERQRKEFVRHLFKKV